jgi:hypothetical protein
MTRRDPVSRIYEAEGRLDYIDDEIAEAAERGDYEWWLESIQTWLSEHRYIAELSPAAARGGWQ